MLPDTFIPLTVPSALPPL